jgi:chromosome partitioning protein
MYWYKGELNLKLTQQELVEKIMILVDESGKRNTSENKSITELLQLLKVHHEELNREFVRHNIGEKRLQLIEDWMKGAERLPKVVSMLNMKGGVGKTTLTFNLAWYAAYKKACRVLVIDLDPQSNLTQTFMGDEGYKDFLKSDNQSIVDIFENSNNVSGEVIQEIKEWSNGSLIHLIPARVELSKTLKNPTTKEHKLRRFLTEYKNAYDLILIDCPPTDSILSVASYLASDSLIIPVKLEKLAIIGLPLLASSIGEFNHDNVGENEINVAGIIFNNVETNDTPENRVSKKEVAAFANENDWYIFENEVRESKAYVNGIREGKPMFLSSRVRDYIMEEFYQVGDEFLQKVGLDE